jgi:hypothetical protein
MNSSRPTLPRNGIPRVLRGYMQDAHIAAKIPLALKAFYPCKAWFYLTQIVPKVYFH